MTEIEIELTRAYLQSSGQDPVAALIRSVRDLTRTLRHFSGGEFGARPAASDEETEFPYQDGSLYALARPATAPALAS
ncbi:hypothetical protein [uncultured Enterovirga sp.]|uniref:hypothetical protein n=1 Tax=uncultured Enterovirga sp. TaxID=2026352 RepID=UPI0035CABDDF